MIRVGKGVQAVRCGGAERGVSEVATRAGHKSRPDVRPPVVRGRNHSCMLHACVGDMVTTSSSIEVRETQDNLQ